MSDIYYQLGIKTKSGELIALFDSTSHELILEKYVTPYVEKKDFIFSGRFIHFENIQQFVIVGLHVKVDDWVDQKNRVKSQNPIKREDIFDGAHNLFDYFLTRVPLNNKINQEKVFTKNKNVFIVHGHNQSMLSNVKKFIKKEGFVPITLKDAPNQGKTIIEKLEALSNACYAIVLYSPCDVGFPKGCFTEQRPRARQNVVFEHGYFLAKLSRSRVCALVKKGIDIPSDLNGMLVITYSGNWRERVKNELFAAGLFDER